MADLGALALLETGAAPSWYGEARPIHVVITEGEPDYLAWATRFGDAAEAPPPVFGVFSGGWTREVAARVPSGAVVLIRNHPDAKGEQYARQIASSLGDRCDVRWMPIEGRTP